MGIYRTIVADPPWEIGKKIRPGGRRAVATEVPYEFMSIEDIEAVPVAEWAAEDCALFLWSTRRNFREGIAVRVARAWGFEPCGELMWGLRNPGLGTPRALAADHEPILVAKRGRYTLRLRLSDAEGNVGAPVTAPLAYDCVRSEVGGGTGLTVGLGKDGAPSELVKQGQGTTLSGQLRGGGGGVPGAALCVFSTVVTDSEREFLGIAMTSSGGRVPL